MRRLLLLLLEEEDDGDDGDDDRSGRLRAMMSGYLGVNPGRENARVIAVSRFKS